MEAQEWTEETYIELIRPYAQAMGQMLGQIEKLEQILALAQEEPLHHIKSRIKTRESIAAKLAEKGLPPTADTARTYLSDIAGIRLVFYFESDLRRMAGLLKSSSGFLLLREKDYIAQPKESGYRSLHLIFSVPVSFKGKLQKLPVEIQLRTVGMDFWAGIEHRLCYKRRRAAAVQEKQAAGEPIMRDFAGCALLLASLEKKMEEIAIADISCYNRAQKRPERRDQSCHR